MVELLTEIGFGNFAATFINSHFTIEGMMAIERNDLIDLGLEIGQSRQFLLALDKFKQRKEQEKEEERKKDLKIFLEKIKKVDLLDTFIDKKVQASEVSTLSEEDLSKFGISFWKRKGWLKSINKFREGKYFNSCMIINQIL